MYYIYNVIKISIEEGIFKTIGKETANFFYVNASSIVSCAINISIEKGIFKTTRKETTMFFI